MKQITITANDSNRRADQFLRREMPALPQGLLYRALRLGKIKLGGKKIKPDTRLQSGDILSVYLEDEFFAKTAAPLDFLRAPRNLDVLYEDENILLLDKPSGLLCHADDKEFADTLIARVQRYLYDKGEFAIEGEGTFVPALANRIDRNTSGIVIAAKNAEALRALNEKIKMREVEKRYLCLVCGTPPRIFFCDNFLQKDSRANMVRVFDEPSAGRKSARTEFHTLESRSGYSLLEARLITGRTHQIRAQLAYACYPLVGDGKYGNFMRSGKSLLSGYKKQFLCAYRLQFSFKSDTGILAYLNGRAFTVGEPWFAVAFHAGEFD
ncbi:MAG: RluA family pseudouridine synthase [Oscillospiraceae bacterium]|jgi:23S rRNA pseudouridine955/2504/2580 synthase|nr:RluA family pseudouridine synthase [Oscillospiraceae bacterium]